MAESGSKSSCGSTCKRGVSFGLSALVAAAFEYDTPKIVHIKNKKVGVLNRLVQLGIIAFVIGYGIIYQKGYQKTGRVESVVTTKVKGAYVSNGTENYTQNCADPEALMNAPWDVGDLIIPPEQPNSFFVMTNTWITCNQKYNVCVESPSVHDSKCFNDSDCEKGVVLEGGNGPMTGKCVLPDDGGGGNQSYCQITAWCPTQIEDKAVTASGPKIDVSNFTVLVKNSIEFPTLRKGERRRNIRESANSTFLQTCHKDDGTQDLYCPIFSLQQIVDMIPPDNDGKPANFTELAIFGGVVGLDVVWDCDLDWGLASCDPKYSAKRLDNPNVKLSPGFNFRFPKYYETDGVQSRKVYKAYGILFKIEVSGTGGQFDFVTLVLKLGSMVALLSIATIICDVIVLYVLGKRTYYRQKKYLNVNDPIPDDYQIIGDEDNDEVMTSPSTLPSVNTKVVN